MRRIALLGAIVALTSARNAAADAKEFFFGNDFRDGCPAYFNPSLKGRLNARGVPLPTHENQRAFGTLPDPDSPLGGTRFTIGANARQLTKAASSLDLAGYTDGRWFGTSTALANLAFDSGLTLMVDYSGSMTLFRDDPMLRDQYDHLGNLRGFVGFRAGTYVFGDAIRAGFAIRAGGGASTTAKSKPEESRELERLDHIAQASAFHPEMMAYDRPLVASVEGRIEIIGCHSPFLDLRIDAMHWNAQRYIADAGEREDGAYPVHPIQPSRFMVPVRLAFGMSVFPPLAFAFQIGLANGLRENIVGEPGMHSLRTDGYHLTRVGLLGEFHPPTLPISAQVQLESITGDANEVVIGVNLTVHVNQMLDGWGGFE